MRLLLRVFLAMMLIAASGSGANASCRTLRLDANHTSAATKAYTFNVTNKGPGAVVIDPLGMLLGAGENTLFLGDSRYRYRIILKNKNNKATVVICPL